MGLCDSLFFQPSRRIYEEPPAYGLRYRNIELAVGPGDRLHGWFFEAQRPARALVVHCHGNAGNITGHFPFIAWMPEAGIHVLAFDYRGYGRSTGAPSRGNVVEDGLAATRLGLQLAGERRVPVVLFGQSLGGAVAVSAAVREPRVAGVVLDSAFSSYRREAAWVARQSLLLWPAWRLFGRWLISDGPDPVGEIGCISPRPVLIMHGKHDRIVDWRQSVELYEAAGEPKDLWLIDDCDHCQIWGTWLPEAKRRFLRLLDYLPH